MRSTTTGKELLKIVKEAVKQDPEYKKIPILSALSVVGTFLATIALTLILILVLPSSLTDALIAIGYILITSSVALVTYFFQVALTHGANERFEGNDPNIKNSIEYAKTKIKKLIPYAIIYGTVGYILKMFGDRGLFSKIIQSVLGATWSILNIFTVQIIALEELTTLQSMRKSQFLFLQKWGKTVRTTARLSLKGVGIIFLFIIGGLAGVIFIASLSNGDISKSITGLVILAIIFVALFTYFSLLYATYATYTKTILYRYANNMKVIGVEEYILQGAFNETIKEKKKEK